MKLNRMIETKEEFLVWAKEVNACMSAKVRCDLQDVFARSSFDLLKKLFLESENEKQILTFSISKAMGEDTCYKFIKAWALKKAHEAIEEEQADINLKYAALWEKQKAFEEGKKQVDLIINSLQRDNADLREELKRSQKRLQEVYTADETKSNIIDELRQDLADANTEIVKIDTFKKTMKEILGPLAVI